MRDQVEVALPNGARCVVIDGFYSDPDKVRALGLRAGTWPGQGAANFAGSETKSSFYNADLLARLADVVGANPVVDESRLTFGKFRLSQAHDVAPTGVHIDFTDWAAMVYLTPDEHVAGGLAVYASTDPDLDGVPDGTGLEALGYESLRDFDRRFVTPRTADPSRWALLDVVEGRYNRLVVFQGCKVFHGISEQYGMTRETGRLTHNFFFDVA